MASKIGTGGKQRRHKRQVRNHKLKVRQIVQNIFTKLSFECWCATKQSRDKTEFSNRFPMVAKCERKCHYPLALNWRMFQVLRFASFASIVCPPNEHLVASANKKKNDQCINAHILEWSPYVFEKGHRRFGFSGLGGWGLQ